MTATVRSTIRPRAAGIFACALVTACVGAPDGADDVDGDGSDGAAAAGPRVDPSPALTIPAQGGDEAPAIGYVRDAIRLDDGSIVVADSYGMALHFFGPDGGFVRSVGTEGTGPGEFRGGPRSLHRCAADSLFVFDYSKRAVLVFDGEGDFAREFRPEGNPQEVHCSGDGWIGIMSLPDGFTSPGDEERATTTLSVADLEGRLVRELARVPFAQNLPLGKKTAVAVSGERMYVGTADSAYVRVHGRSGDTLGMIPVGAPPRSPSEAHVEEWVRRAVSVTSARELRDRFTEQYMALEPAASLPPYIDLGTDPAGNLWAVVSPPGESRTVLQAVSPEGEPLGEVAVPEDVEVFEVGADHLLGATTDDTGAQSVVLYRLHR